MSKRHWFLFAAAASLVAVQACSDSDPGTSYPGNGGSGGSKAGAGGHAGSAGHAGAAHAGTGAISDAGQGGADTGDAGAGGSDTSNAGTTNGGSGGTSTGGSAGVGGTSPNGGSGGSHAGTSGSGGSAAGSGGSAGSHAGTGGTGGSGGGSAGASGSGGASGGTAGVSGSGGASSGSGGSGGAAATTFTLQSTTLGQVIGTANGLSLYVFKPDTPGTSSTAPVSTCTGGCLAAWPIYYGNPVSVPSGLLVSDFGSFDRGGNVMQSTYKGWPLYTFSGDSAPGNVNGEGSGTNWYTAKNPFVSPK